MLDVMLIFSAVRNKPNIFSLTKKKKIHVIFLESSRMKTEWIISDLYLKDYI